MDKFLKISFTVIALFALIFGFISLGQSLKITINQSASESSTEELPNLDQAKLRVLDTDEDGLNDWQELGTYGTSPYLADTDSDGVNDFDELEAGTDPNCPPGRSCSLNNIDENESSTFADIDSSQSLDDALKQEIESDFQTGEDLSLDGVLTADQIRDLLRDGGVSEQELQAASDEDLILLFEEVINQL